MLKGEKLTKRYQEAGHTVEVLKGVTIHIAPGERVAIMGRSGSGKTTLLNLLGGLESPTSGSVWLQNTCISTQSAAERALLRNHAFGFIFQFHHLLMEFNALENVAMPLLLREEPQALALEAAKPWLSAVGLEHRFTHYPAQLSGGERQRIAIARALITKPRCILADEPTGNLDIENAQKVIELILKLSHQENTSCVLVTHDPNLAKQLDRIVYLEDGQVLTSS